LADKNTGLRYALDESLAAQYSAGQGGDSAAFAALLQGPGLAALVLKPTLIGGFARCISLHRRAPAGTEVRDDVTRHEPVLVVPCFERGGCLCVQR